MSFEELREEVNVGTYEIPMTLYVEAASLAEANVEAAAFEKVRDGFVGSSLVWLHAGLTPSLAHADGEGMPGVPVENQ